MCVSFPVFTEYKLENITCGNVKIQEFLASHIVALFGHFLYMYFYYYVFGVDEYEINSYNNIF